MKNTRTYDLAELEQARDEAPTLDVRKNLTALLESVYEQSKDAQLEKYKKQLMNAIRAGNMKEINRIRDGVIAYTSSTNFTRNLYGKMNRISNKTAERYVKNK